MKNNKRVNVYPVKLIEKINLLLVCLFFFQSCTISKTENIKNGLAEKPFSPIVPLDIDDPADSLQAAEFAWAEFVALIWPAKPNPNKGTSGFYRCQPDTSARPGSTGANGVVVWETFYHRDELYPNYPDYNNHTLPPQDTIPNYYYGGNTISLATPTTKQNLFNNLDEASEITLAYMYYTPLAKKADSLTESIKTPTPQQQKLIADAKIKAGLMYEAKGNSTIYKYLKHNNFNNAGPRRNARNKAINKIMNKTDTTGAFQLPYGSLETKATWRHYDALRDNLIQFHWTVGMYYTKDTKGNLVVHNDTLLLVALHIIQKTPHVPTFIFATFEHVSNEKNGFRFTNTNPLTVTSKSLPRSLPDSGVIAAKRQFSIPTYITKLNDSVQQQLRNVYGNLAWANYQLIGVQTLVTNDPSKLVPPQRFFLSNFATETNDALQFFQGGLAGPNSNVPNPNTAHVFKLDRMSKKYIAYTSGGCLGCHGSQGQFPGGDFSVIAASGNASFVPEPVTPYPGGKVVPQNPAGFPLPH